MYWNTAFHRTSWPYPRPRARRGSVIIECVIATMLISVAAIGLLQLKQTASQLNRQADDRTAAVLIADNLAFSLQQIPFDQLTTASQALAHQTEQETNSDITITSQAFTANQAAADTPGLHLTIVVGEGISGKAVRHVWRFPAKELVSELSDPGANIQPTRSFGLASSPTLPLTWKGESR